MRTLRKLSAALLSAAILRSLSGDTLWKIAKGQLGDGAKWSAIFEANKSVIKNPNLIYERQTLTIPGA